MEGEGLLPGGGEAQGEQEGGRPGGGEGRKEEWGGGGLGFGEGKGCPPLGRPLMGHLGHKPRPRLPDRCSVPPRFSCI